MHGWDDGSEARKAAAAMGLQLDTPEPEPLGIWPEHWIALQVFQAMRTQWNVGMSGPIGLRYEALPVVMSDLAIDDPVECRALVYALEHETLKHLDQHHGNRH